jgi:hypothetical protein
MPAKPQARVRPGRTQLLMSIATGIATGITGAILAQLAGAKPGMPGFAAGIGFCLGFFVLWRGLGGTVQDLKDMFK